jgi:hypothetical protein
MHMTWIGPMYTVVVVSCRDSCDSCVIESRTKPSMRLAVVKVDEETLWQSVRHRAEQEMSTISLAREERVWLESDITWLTPTALQL